MRVWRALWIETRINNGSVIHGLTRALVLASPHAVAAAFDN